MGGDPFYWSSPWRKARAAHLVLHPICQVPGCMVRAEHVDHRTPRAQGGAPFDSANLQSLCKPHHSQKTASADGGFGNRRGAVRMTVPGCDASGRPVDPDHPWNKARS